MDSGITFYILVVFSLTSKSFVSSSYPKCENETAPTWTELRGNDFSYKTAITDCKNACRTGPKTTLCAVQRNGPQGNKAACFCGDTAVNPGTGCSWDCEGDEYANNCGGQDSLSAHTVCAPGRYDTDCSLYCPGNCEDNVCDVEDGSCHVNCQPGYYGNKCGTACPSTDCINDTCNKTNGDCMQCPLGWYTPTCQTQCSDQCAQESCTIYEGACGGGCKSGWYTPQCTEQCSPNCAATSCENDNGHCDNGCEPGWYQPTCTVQCSQNCVQTTCDINNGTCDVGCTDGWYGSSCNNSCPANCAGGCDRHTGDCSRCKDGSYGERCELSCPCGCNQTVCDINTGKCTHGCNSGYYGNDCMKCPINCNDTCNSVNGSCMFQCDHGWYGEKCTEVCPTTCYMGVCDSVTGYCHNACVNGYYGYMCEKICPSNCKNNVCSMTDGLCTDGCVSGWAGGTCQEEDTYIPVWVWPVIVVALVIVGPALGAVGMWLFLSRRYKLIQESSNGNKDVTYDNAGWLDVEEENKTGKRTDYVNDFVAAQTRESSTDYVNGSAEPGAYQEVGPQETIPPNVYDKLEV